MRKYLEFKRSLNDLQNSNQLQQYIMKRKIANDIEIEDVN